MPSLLQPKIRPRVATIGFFDGVHLGHQWLMGQVARLAARRGMESLAVSFDQHPRQVLHDAWQPRLLCSNAEKVRLIKACGIESVELLHFDRDTAAMSAHDFMRSVLHARLGVAALVIGYDNRFGRRSADEGFDDYVRYGRDMGIDVVRADEYRLYGVAISSSVVRSFLEAGEAEQAARCLGRPYAIAGTVGHGRQIGRTIGFPTANIEPDDKQRLVPAGGVYEVDVALGDRLYKGMANIGTRPTFDNGERTIEVNILNFNSDIYGRDITIYFLRRIRAERRFGSARELQHQLECDRQSISSPRSSSSPERRHS